MKKIYLSFIIVFFIFISGCVRNNQNAKSDINSKYDPFNIDSKDTSAIQAYYGFGPVIIVKELSYSGRPIINDYFYDCLGSDCKVGMLLFLDGILQPYKIDNNENTETMHIFNLKEKEKINFTLSFTPMKGQIGEELGLYYISIFNPEFIPSLSNVGYGNYHSISQTLPVSLKISDKTNELIYKSKTSFEKQIITDSIKKEYNGDSLNSDDKNDVLITTSYFNILYNNEKYGQIKTNNKKLTLTLEGLGGDNAKYRTTIFIDNKPVKTADGYDFIEMQLNKGYISKQNFEIDISNLSGLHTLYTISVPINSDFKKQSTQVVKTESRLISIE